MSAGVSPRPELGLVHITPDRGAGVPNRRMYNGTFNDLRAMAFGQPVIAMAILIRMGMSIGIRVRVHRICIGGRVNLMGMGMPRISINPMGKPIMPLGIMCGGAVLGVISSGCSRDNISSIKIISNNNSNSISSKISISTIHSTVISVPKLMFICTAKAQDINTPTEVGQKLPSTEATLSHSTPLNH